MIGILREDVQAVSDELLHEFEQTARLAASPTPLSYEQAEHVSDVLSVLIVERQRRADERDQS